MKYEYKAVQVPQLIAAKDKKHHGKEAEIFMQAALSEHAADGWEYFRIEKIGVIERVGAWDSLFGKKGHAQEQSVLTFRRQASSS